MKFWVSMGICLNSRIKVEIPSQRGMNSKSIRTDGNSLSGSSSNSKASSVPPPTQRSEGEILRSTNLKSFTFAQVKTATGNFSREGMLGEGGFGSVFKGWIGEDSIAAANSRTGMVIAVKRLNKEGLQGQREWLAEINYLGQLYHPHLVKLIGYCLEDEHRLLIYEFMPRGSLENHLFRRGTYFQPLSWSLRLKVALGAAKGLAFLHSSKVIYRDLKTSNILLDRRYNAKLSDFGLAKDGPTDEMSHVSTSVVGTYWYAAPEYLATGHLTAKSDVYSFGVVLLEILSGRRVIDRNRRIGEQNLVQWAKPYLDNKKKVFRVLDSRLEGQYTIDDAHKVASLTLQCLSMQIQLRPEMDEVVAELEQLQTPEENERAQGESDNSIPGRICRHSADDARSGNIATYYPRPSNLYA